ncbi:hypothetical protein [Solimicrobium silvestre]|uniref:Uncharacterized protein n=1 Tax=Solimicrobium silvestre TaxID=2099400 RepID=A0A2S9H0E4_9BURK|nr:hypothetical protein [Solimicrobium silvestre]PRC93452.1 hypothetical protein S2091_1839 [Solimicrobium silvestre]
MANQELQFTISLAQGNLILEALAERPFKQVFEIIGHLTQQAAILFPAEAGEESIGSFIVSVPQLRLILEVLGEIPYNRVNRLLHQLHQQLHEALDLD